MTRLDSRIDWSFVRMVAALALVALLGAATVVVPIQREQARHAACAAVHAASAASGEWQ